MRKTLALGAVLLVALAYVAFQGIYAKSILGFSRNNTPDRIEASLSQLRQPGSRDLRLQAARFIATNADQVTPEMVHQLGQPLLNDRDVVVRKEVADTMRLLASRHCPEELTPAKFEPQMLEILLAAYNQEADENVRINIVRAAGQMNHPDALLILDKAAADTFPAVRSAAQEARTQRERRLLAARTG